MTTRKLSPAEREFLNLWNAIRLATAKKRASQPKKRRATR